MAQNRKGNAGSRFEDLLVDGIGAEGEATGAEGRAFPFSSDYVHEHIASLGWKPDQPQAVAKGHRKDGAPALYSIVALADTGRIRHDLPRTAPAPIAALIRGYVAEPPRG